MSAPVRASHPVSFSLLNDYGYPVLNLLDDPEGQSLKLEIVNSSPRDWKLAGLAADEATPESHHFELRFRPGVLDTGVGITLAGGDGGWRISKPAASNGAVSLYLLSKEARALAAGASISLTLQHVSADWRDGARGTKVELKYKNLEYAPGVPAQAPEQLAGQRLQHLSIGNQRGEKYIPLHVGFVGSNTVLNDGSTRSERTLRITNLLRNESLRLSARRPAVTQFILFFDVYDPNEQNEWALGNSASVENIQVQAVKFQNGREAPDVSWSVRPDVQGETPVWIITPRNKTELRAGESLQLKLSNVVSQIRSGQANVYLRYVNIEGYWDGQFVTALEKSHLVLRDQLPGGLYEQESYVGIGTNDPKSHLDVNGVANIWGGEHYAASHGRMKPGSLTLGSCSASYGGSTRKWEDNNVASLLLETLNNTEIAVHNHNRRLASLMYYEGGDVNRITIGRNMGDDSLSTLAINGNVGIGTTDPKAKLQVVGDALINGKLGVGTADLKSKLQVAGDAVFDGKVGIGQTDPQRALDIRSDNSSWGMLRLRSGAANEGEATIGFLDNTTATDNTAWVAGVGGWANPGDFTIGNESGTGGVVKLLIEKSGNVGIGTTSPVGHLEISNGRRDWLIFRQERSGTAGGGGGGFRFHNPWGDGDGDERNRLEIAYQSADGNSRWGQFVIHGPSGNVGIGTDTPGKGKLEINGTASGEKPGFSYKKWLSIDGLHTGGVPNQALSIYASGDIGVGAVFVFSDERMKNIQCCSDGAADLHTLLGIEVTDFRYKDVVGKGHAPHKKLIAQQVEKVFPQAVSKQTDVVPDIYRQASIMDGWVGLATDLKKGERVRLISENTEGVYEVLEVAQDKFRTDFNPEGDKVFVFGREWNDCRSVDYDAIAMLNVSATQQLKKEKDAEVKALRAELAELKAANAALHKRLHLLESRAEMVQSVVSAKNGPGGNGKH